MSASIILRNSSDVPPPGLTAMPRSLPATSGSRIARENADCSLLTIAGGVDAGANMPLHSLVLTSGKPAPAMLGTSGNSGERNRADLAVLDLRDRGRTVGNREQALLLNHAQDHLGAALERKGDARCA